MANILNFVRSSGMSHNAVAPVGNVTNIANASSVQTLTAPAGATILMLQSDGAAGSTEYIRYTFDGTNPTTTLGFLNVPDAGMVTINLGPGQVVKVISGGATQGVNYQWARIIADNN